MINKEVEDVLKKSKCTPNELYHIVGYIELLERENIALASDGEMKCDLIDELKRKVKGLETTNKRQQEQLDRYYRSVMK